MSIYYVYQLIDPRNGQPFYIGKGSGNRAYSHAKFKDGNNNPHKDRVIKKIINEQLEPLVEIVHDNIHCETKAYDLETELIRKIGISNLTNICEDARPPSRKGWTPSHETLAKRSKSLKGIERSDIWKKRLSECKSGKLNPMYGKKNPCNEEKRIQIIRTKNIKNYDLYKTFLVSISTGESVPSAYKRLGIPKGVAYRLANGSHGIFDAFSELIQFKRC